MNNFQEDMYATRPQPVGGNQENYGYAYPQIMQMGGHECHHIFHVEEKNDKKKTENTMGDWIEVALKKGNAGKKTQTKKQANPMKLVVENSFNSFENDNVDGSMSVLSGVHNCIGHPATWGGLAVGGFKSPVGCSEDKTETNTKMTKNMAATITRNPGSEPKRTTQNRNRSKVAMAELEDSSDSEAEPDDRTSNPFGSSLKNKKVQQETRNFGSSPFGSRPGTEVKKDKEGTKATYAGSSCGHFGSGSSPPGCHFSKTSQNSPKSDKSSKDILNLLEHKAKEAENIISAVEECWEQMSILIDSGSTETVAPEKSLIGYELISTDWSETGKGYSAANGTDIPNLGEKIVKGQTSNGMWCTMRFQICNVTKPLGSVSRICQAGSRVVFGPPEEGSYIEHIITRKRTMLRQSKGLYYLDMWIAPASTFPRQGGNM